MSRRRAWSIGSSAVIAIMVSSQVTAQDVTAGMRACAKEADDAARLRCYDSEVRRVQAEPQVATPMAAPAAAAKSGSARAPEPVATAPELTPEQAFGTRGTTLAREEVDRRKEVRDTLERMDAVVARADQKPLGEFVLTLENGQVWAQKSPDPRIRVKSGDAVTIKRASLGSFLMTVPNGRTTQVARVK